MTRPALNKAIVAMLFNLAASIFAQNAQASTLEAINHTHWAINRFSVDGRSGLDIIGPYQGGGGGCCYIAPARWQPGMTVQIDWETGSSGASELADEFPGFADEAKYDTWLDKVDAQKRQHNKLVQVPDYTGQKVCGLTVHFLPCDELEVTTSCHAYGSPDYPIKTLPWRLRIASLCATVGILFMQHAQASTLEAINHTHWAINHFSVDGRSGLDIIGPYQGGGGGCCYIAPARWQPGMTVRVDWETGIAYAYDSPGYADWPKYLAWVEKIDAQKRQHSKVVPVPDYTGEKVCGLTVHFLPCDELEVTTSCHAYGSPDYPIKTPLHLPEPQSCPK